MKSGLGISPKQLLSFFSAQLWALSKGSAMPAQKSKKGERLVAIEVNSTGAWETVCAINPHYKELDPVANGGNFVVITSEDPKLVGAILAPEAIAEHFDHIEPNDRTIKFVTIVR